MGDVIDSNVMHINKGNALFARESKLVCGKSKGSQKRGLSLTLVDYSGACIEGNASIGQWASNIKRI